MFLVIRIVNRKVCIISQSVNISPEDPHTGRMEGTDPDTAAVDIRQLIHTIPHLSCCFIRKCDSQNIPGIDLLFGNKIRYPLGKYSGLAGTGSGYDKQRPFCTLHGLLLLRVQLHKFLLKLSVKFSNGKTDVRTAVLL